MSTSTRLLEELLDLLLGEGGEVVVELLGVVLHPHAHEELHELGLEVAAEVDLLGAVVVLLLAVGQLVEAVAHGALAGGGVLLHLREHVAVDRAPVEVLQEVRRAGWGSTRRSRRGRGRLRRRPRRVQRGLRRAWRVATPRVIWAMRGLGKSMRVFAVEGGADQVLDEGAAQGQGALLRPARELELLDEAVGALDAGVLEGDAVVDAGVLGDGEEVGGHLALGEEVEEVLHVGDPGGLFGEEAFVHGGSASNSWRRIGRTPPPGARKLNSKLPNSRWAVWWVA